MPLPTLPLPAPPVPAPVNGASLDWGRTASTTSTAAAVQSTCLFSWALPVYKSIGSFIRLVGSRWQPAAAAAGLSVANGWLVSRQICPPLCQILVTVSSAHFHDVPNGVSSRPPPRPEAGPRLAVDVVCCLYFVRYCYCCCYYYTIDDAATAAADVCRSTWCLSICPGLCLYTERVCVCVCV